MTDVVYVTAVDPTPEIIEVTVGDLIGPEGPQGPEGVGVPPGGTDGQVVGKSGITTVWLDVGTSTEIDTKIATHNQAEVVHTNASSGRDFVALFQNGLI